MSVYVGIDVHRKRSQVAVVTEDGQVVLNKNVVSGSTPMLRLIGELPRGRRWRPGPRSAGAGWPISWRTTACRLTWCTRCGTRRSPRPG
jgi:transposase